MTAEREPGTIEQKAIARQLDTYAPQCECGRGPILPGNGVPEVCGDCFSEGTMVADSEGERLVPNTVKRATLFEGVVDTFQTEAELNGFRASQGKLL